MNNSIIKILVSTCLLIALNANAEYKPTITFEKTVDTYNVKKDGIKTTDDSLSEGAPMFSDSKHKIIIFPNVKDWKSSLLYLRDDCT